MRELILLVCVLFTGVTAVQAATPSKEKEAAASAVSGTHAQAAGATAAQVGRFQLVVVPGHTGSPFIIDTGTGCVWHQVQNEQTKRTTFVEVDVENLHWSWGSGAQSMLASRVDGSNLTDEQKRVLKESLQKTGCGVSNVVLTPGPSPAGGQTPAPKAP